MYHETLYLNLHRSTIKALCGLHLWIDHSVNFCIINLPADEITKAIWITEELKSHHQEITSRNVTSQLCKRYLSQVCNMMMISNEGQTQSSATNRIDQVFSY
jgi:hypothetical protein